MRWAREPTATWRLAVPGVVAFALGAGVVAAGLELAMARSVRARGDDWLLAEARGVARLVSGRHGAHLQAELEGELEELRHHQGSGLLEPEDRSQSLFFLAVVGVEPGRVVAADGDLRALARVLERTHAAPERVERVRVPGWEYPVRVAVAALPGGGRLVVGATPNREMELVEDLGDLAFWGWLAVVAVGTAASVWAVRGVLARVERVREVAAALPAGDPGGALPVSPRGDEIDRLAATFNRLLERHAAAVRELRALADALAHDLRGPLTALRGALERALGVGDAEGIREAAAEALERADRLAALIEAELDVAESEAGALRVRREVTDLARLAEELVELYAPAAGERGLALALDAPAPVPVAADAGLLRRALVNLLDNVLTHLPRGCTATVRVRPAGRGAVLEVADDGPGFPPEVGERAFERGASRGGSGGRGLGLAVVRAVARAHGGRAELERPTGGGSVVRLVLPGPP